jgi:hypothetical protein
MDGAARSRRGQSEPSRLRNLTPTSHGVLACASLALACVAPRAAAQSVTYHESEVTCLCPIEGETWAVGFAGGPTWLDGEPGGYGRLTLTPAFAVASPKRPFPARFELGMNGWKDIRSGSADYGLAGPTLKLLVGYEQAPVFALAGPTFDLFSWQSMSGRHQLGMFAPGIRSVLGFVLHSVRLGVEASYVYRWHIGTPDRVQIAVGLSLALAFWETPDCDQVVSCPRS